MLSFHRKTPLQGLALGEQARNCHNRLRGSLLASRVPPYNPSNLTGSNEGSWLRLLKGYSFLPSLG